MFTVKKFPCTCKHGDKITHYEIVCYSTVDNIISQVGSKILFCKEVV